MPVINPIWFYLMSVCNSVGVLVVGGCCLSGITAGICWAFDGQFSKRCKKALVVCVVCAVLAVFCPTQKTLEKVLIAQNVTYERVEQAADTVTDVYNDIMDLFRESESDE